MPLRIVRILSLVSVALTLGPALAHLLEAPRKLRLSHDDYLVVQQIYRGWAWLGVVILVALASTLALAILVRRRPREFFWIAAAWLALAAAQAVFWTWTFPANLASREWTILPADWRELRTQWEYSHCAGLLNLLAMTALSIGCTSRGTTTAE